MHQLVVQHSGRGVAHAKLAVQRQAGQASLGLADQIDRQTPDRQRQLRALKQAARSQRSLVAAGAALVQRMRPAADDAVVAAGANRALKAVGPSHLRHRLRALRLRAKRFVEI